MPAPTFEQEMLVARMRENWAGDMIRIQPTLATVLRSGGTGLVYVKPDGSRPDAESLVPFVAGIRLSAGQRVIVMPTQGGAPIVTGVVPTSTGQYAVIGTEHIIPGSITADLLASGAISYSSLDVDTRGRIDRASSDAAQAISLANSVSSTANNAYSLATTANNAAGVAQNTANTALSNANSAQNTANTALNRINNFSYDIPALSVTSGKLASNAVTSPKIADGAVTLIKCDLDTIRKPIAKIDATVARVAKLCLDRFGQNTCGIAN